jgi:putative endonuclease
MQRQPMQRQAVRRRAERRGRLAEALCVLSLWLRGYRILARGFRVHSGEIDIIARRARVLALIEVKARGDFGAAAEAIGFRQRRRIERAAAQFLKGRPDLALLDVRFDAMLVAGWRLPRHLAGAWTGRD